MKGRVFAPSRIIRMVMIDKTKINKIKFAFAFVLSCLTMNSDNVTGYSRSAGTAFVFFKLAMIILFMSLVTFINRNNALFISKVVKVTLLTITPFVIFDNFVTNISGSQKLFRYWWMGYILASAVSVFLTLTIEKAKDYSTFYYTLWKSITPLYVFMMYICFWRAHNTNFSTNFKLGNGTFLMLKAIIRNPHIDWEPYLLFIGNVIVFFPLAFILLAFIKRIKPYQLALIGLAAPFLAEGYQYIFKCGDVDIDDIILNWFGFFVGFIIQQIIQKRLLTKSE